MQCFPFLTRYIFCAFLSWWMYRHPDQLVGTQDGSYSLHVLCLLVSLLCSTEVLIGWHSYLLRLLCSGSWALVSLVYITSSAGILEYLLLFLHTTLQSFLRKQEEMVGFLSAEYFLPSQVNSSRPAIRLNLLVLFLELTTNEYHTCRYWSYVFRSWPLHCCIYQGMKNGLYVYQSPKGIYA